ncbi:hypothetical protein [Anaerocolumna sp.]|uniref:hypothetical protein n=1 Tax=Anaerocolumna sp. TaxID=2041569 RepID=UPI0028A921A4|nr:hypothetical protein [Anaerocolumna sp.]
MLDEIKKKQIYNVLLMPIQCTKHSGFNDERKVDIIKTVNGIKTTQTYWVEYKNKNTGTPFRYNFQPDCDMSDFACGFYEIIYKEFLDGKKVVDDNGCLVDNEFAGDTMTSVSRLPGLKNKYHCLANFWIIPMELGRKSIHELSKTSNRYCIKDFMDRFLLLLKFNLDDYKKIFPNYFSKIDIFSRMSDIHLINESYLDKQHNIMQYSDVINKDTEDYLWNCIKKRAEAISNSRFGPELWYYFAQNNILEN